MKQTGVDENDPLCFSPHPTARVYKEGWREGNPSYWGNAFHCYLGPQLQTPCAITTSPALSSQDATGAVAATPGGIVLAVATSAPTPQWAMVLAMTTMGVGLSTTEDSGYFLSIDFLKYPRHGTFSPKAERNNSRSSCAHQPPSHCFSDLAPESQGKKMRSTWCLQLPSLDDVCGDICRNLTPKHVLLLNFSPSSWCLSSSSCGSVCQILNKLVSTIIIFPPERSFLFWWVHSFFGGYIWWAYFLVHWVGREVDLFFSCAC